MNDSKAAEILRLKSAGKSGRQIAKELSLPETTVRRVIKKTGSEGVLKEIPGHIVKGTSTLVDSDGNTKLQWIKTRVDESEIRAATEAAVRASLASIKPLPKIPAPRDTNKDLVTLYTLTDAHVGSLSWGKECGDDWDLEIAEKTIIETFADMINAAPASEQAVINQLGDYFHYNDLKPVTPTSGHILDADSRFQKMVETGVRVLRAVVEMTLQKHKRVHVVMAEGNHELTGSVWLRILFAALYEKNPRVTVEQSPLPYYIYQHGKTMIGMHHSHLLKMDKLPLFFAAKFPEIWGSTKYRYIHTGHLHHIDEKESPGAVVLQHPTLTAQDAYASRGGWISERRVIAIHYHRERGEVSRQTFIPPKVKKHAA